VFCVVFADSLNVKALITSGEFPFGQLGILSERVSNYRHGGDKQGFVFVSADMPDECGLTHLRRVLLL